MCLVEKKYSNCFLVNEKKFFFLRFWKIECRVKNGIIKGFLMKINWVIEFVCKILNKIRNG